MSQEIPKVARTERVGGGNRAKHPPLQKSRFLEDGGRYETEISTQQEMDFLSTRQ